MTDDIGFMWAQFIIKIVPLRVFGLLIKCRMETVERCCATVGKMHNAEICRMWAIVCPREGSVYFMPGQQTLGRRDIGHSPRAVVIIIEPAGQGRAQSRLAGRPGCVPYALHCCPGVNYRRRLWVIPHFTNTGASVTGVQASAVPAYFS